MDARFSLTDCGMPNRVFKSEIPEVESQSKLDPADLSFPWNVLLYVRNESVSSTTFHQLLCAATLVGKTTVITSAGCLMIGNKSSITPDNLIVVLNPGSEIFSENLLNPKSRVFNVST